jgi:glycosyltransferase involved in cell wall biosynthesis
LREWIRDGYNGYLVAPGDESKLAERIVRVLQSPEVSREFVQRNFEIVRTRASQSAGMERMEEIYRLLATR